MVGIGADSAQAASHPASYAWSSTLKKGPGWELQSSSGVYTATFQSDANLVVRHGSQVIWATNTNGDQPSLLYLFANGDVAVLDNYGCTNVCGIFWQNGVNHSSGTFHLSMQNDGNFVEYTGASVGTALWATNTAGR